ncbi:MAG: hypothetical protein V3U90_06110 [Dehalococcoidia bacterium]
MGTKRRKQDKEFPSWLRAIPRDGVIQYYGFRRKGKTRCAWGLAEWMHRKSDRPVVAYKFPKKLRHLLPSWVKFADSTEALERLRGYIIVADEMAREVIARDHQSETNKEWIKLLAIVGQYGHLLISISQHSRQIDVGLVMDPDLVIFKQPSLLHIRFARPELRPEIQEAFDRFAGCKGDPRRWAFIVDFHRGRKGFLRSYTPSFWSEELSTAYALAALKAEEKGGAKRSPKSMRNHLRA